MVGFACSCVNSPFLTLESCNGIELLSSGTKSWNSLVADGQWGKWSEGRDGDANGGWAYERAWRWWLQYWAEEALTWRRRCLSICHHRVGECKFPPPWSRLQFFRILGHQNLACRHYAWINILSNSCAWIKILSNSRVSWWIVWFWSKYGGGGVSDSRLGDPFGCTYGKQ
jgi:hypothetical protein